MLSTLQTRNPPIFFLLGVDFAAKCPYVETMKSTNAFETLLRGARERTSPRPSQRKYAKALGVTVGTVSRWERGHMDALDLSTLRQIAGVYGVSLGDSLKAARTDGIVIRADLAQDLGQLMGLVADISARQDVDRLLADVTAEVGVTRERMVKTNGRAAGKAGSRRGATP